MVGEPRFRIQGFGFGVILASRPRGRLFMGFRVLGPVSMESLHLHRWVLGHTPLSALKR